MNRILLLLLDNKHNSRLLSEWLEKHYKTLLPDCKVEEHRPDEAYLHSDEFLLNEPFDLCILDGLALHRLWKQVQARREAEKPGFLPFLLIASRQDVRILTRHLWQSIDELLVTPIEKAELHARVEILLRSRRFSMALQAANEELKTLNELKTRFVSMASHDLRNPLSAIMFSAQLLDRHGDKLFPEQKHKYLDVIQERVHYMTQMLDDLLVISRAEVGKLDFNPSFLELESFCHNLLEKIELSASNKHALAFACYGDCSHVCLDAKLLQHILTNLLANAIKYSPTGGTVSLEVARQNQEVVFQVKDEGIGIPLEDQTQLFESFHRAGNVGQITGTGLGLSIVKQCVERHNGCITVVSEVGVGTTFTVTLPISENEC